MATKSSKKVVPHSSTKLVKKRTKAAAKPQTKKKRTRATKKASLFSAVDQKLMELAADRYEKVFQSISARGNKLNEDRKLALALGQNILSKLKSVQSSLSTAAKSKVSQRKSKIDLNLLNLIKKDKKTAKSESSKNS